MRKKWILPLLLAVGLLTGCSATESKYEDLSDEELVALMLTKLTKEGQTFEVEMESLTFDSMEGIEGYSEETHSIDEKQAIQKLTMMAEYVNLFDGEYEAKGSIEHEWLTQNADQEKLIGPQLGLDYNSQFESGSFEVPYGEASLIVSDTGDLALDGTYGLDIDTEKGLLQNPEFISIQKDTLTDLVKKVNNPVILMTLLENYHVDEMKITRDDAIKLFVESEITTATKDYQDLFVKNYTEYTLDENLQIDSLQGAVVFEMDGKIVQVIQTSVDYKFIE